MLTPIQILGYALHRMTPNQRIIVDSVSPRDRILIHEEFYDKDNENVSYISNNTGNRNRRRFVEDTNSISRILFNTFPILKIEKVYANGNRKILYDHLNVNRLLPTPRRSRTQ